jgi:N-acetylmuramoyl-L-alanine amidase-like protein
VGATGIEPVTPTRSPVSMHAELRSRKMPVKDLFSLASCLLNAKSTLFALLAFSSAFASDAPSILSREAWGAKPPIKEMKTQTPTRLTIHHTASLGKPRLSLQQKLRDLQAFSQSESKLADGRIKQAWADIPYHYYIATNGDIGQAREVKYVGDTNTDYDPSGHIAIVVEGNFEIETPTPAQIDSLVSLLAMLSQQYRIGLDKIGAHKQFAQTLCPGRNLMAQLPAIVAKVKSRIDADRGTAASPNDRGELSTPGAAAATEKPRPR